LSGSLRYEIARIVHDVGIVAAEAPQIIGAAASVEKVAAGIAIEFVGKGVAGQLDRRGRVLRVGGQDFDFAAGGQHVVRAGIDDITSAFARALGNEIVDVVDHVAIVAAEPAQIVGRSTAIQEGGAGVAVDLVDQLVAGQGKRVRRRLRNRGKNFDVRAGRQSIVSTRVDCVPSFVRQLDDDVTGRIDHDNVVARAA